MPINQLTGISCRIIPNDDPTQRVPCPEYKSQSEFVVSTGTRQETVFIESTVGASFAIHLELDNPQVPQQPRADLLIYTSLDGVKVGCSRHSHTYSSTMRMSSVLSSDRRTMRKFQFAPLALVDADDETLDLEARVKLDSELCNDEAVIKNLGSIEINLFRCRLGRKVPCLLRQSDPQRTANQMKFSERCKKAALSNTAGLSDNALPNPRPDIWEHPIEWQEPNPFLQFVFKYRSRALLEAEGIVLPPLPAPAPALLAEPLAMPHSILPQASASKPKLKQDPGQSEKKPSPNFLEIDSEDELEENPKPKVENQTQSIKGESEEMWIKKRHRTIAPSTSAANQVNDQIIIVDNDDGDDDAKENRRNRKKSKIIDLTEG